MGKTHIAFTICTKSYLAGALEWRRTLRQSAAMIRGFIYVVDAKNGELSDLCSEVKNISFEHADGLENDLRCATGEDIPDEKGMKDRYEIIEYCTAIKPSLFLSLARQYPDTILHYFDPDIVVYDKLTELRQFSEKHSITLIPHMTTPTCDNFRLTQLQVLRAGVFNFGYVGWNPNFQSGWPLIQWWQRELKMNCRVALEEGIFTDQSWGVFFCSSPEAGILHDHSYNVAYWNLHERCISQNNSGNYLVNDVNLNFYHFSGYSPTKKDQISLHQNRHGFINNRGLKILFDEYAVNLQKAGFTYWKNKYGGSNNLRNEEGTPLGQICSGIRSEKTYQFKQPYKKENKDLQEAIESKIRSKIQDPFVQPYKNLLKASVLSLWYGLVIKLNKKQKLITYKIIAISNSKIIKISNKNSGAKIFFKRVRTVTDSQTRDKHKKGKYSYFQLWLYWIFSFTKKLLIQLFQKNNNEKITFKDNTSEQSDIALIGYLTAETGVGESSRGIVRAIEYGGGKVDLFDIQGHYARSQDFEYASRVSLKNERNKHYKTSILCVNADQVDVNIQLEPGNVHGISERKIAYWYWETEKLPLNYVHASRHFNQIWVATNFVKKAFVDSGIECAVNVIPPALSELPEKYHDSTHFNFGHVGERPILLSVFDATSFLGRKNPLAAIRAVQGLQRDTPLRPLLVMKTTNLAPQDEIYLKSICPDVEIVIINKYLSKKETLSLIKLSDCFISLHRSEGLGLSLIDAMRIGTPLLATNYSGPVDFANNENAWMVPWEYTNATIEDGPYFGSSWANPIDEEATAMLVEIITNNELRSIKIKKAKTDIEQHFSKKRICSLIEAALM